jgi:thiamine biosynthesis lipoprotein
MKVRFAFLLFTALAAILVLSGCRGTVYKAEQTRTLMDTTVTITVIHQNEQVARNAIEKTFEAMKEVNDSMGPFGNGSEVHQLNNAKIITAASHDFVYVVNRSLFYSRLSGGAFDITVQPILDLYTRTFKVENRTPTEDEIASALKFVGYEKLKLGNNSVSILENMSITLGGIAKGFAVDRAIETLQRNGISRALVNAGGQVRAIGTKEGGRAWMVALQNPRNSTDFITTIEVHNESVSTSGDYVRYFDKDMKYHHIIDPKTGHSATELISVTVIAPTGIDADALSTTVFVLGKEKGMELVERLPNVEALIITSDRQIIRSSGFKY